MELKALQALRDARNVRLGVTEAQYIALRDRMHDLQWTDAKSLGAKEIHDFIHKSHGSARPLLDKHGIR